MTNLRAGSQIDTTTPTPAVSVIVIFLNEERFLEEAIESVLAQTYHDWELLLVDDGSTDRGSDIARDYAQRFAGQIRHLEHGGHANRGMSASRNLGLRHAKGRFIVCDQYGGLFRVTLGAAEGVKVEPIDAQIGGAHGLLYAFGSLFAMVNENPANVKEKLEHGLWRLRP